MRKHHLNPKELFDPHFFTPAKPRHALRRPA